MSIQVIKRNGKAEWAVILFSISFPRLFTHSACITPNTRQSIKYNPKIQ